MAAITACNTGISQSFAFEDSTGVHLRVASFASYLSNDDDVFTLKLGESSRSLNPVLSPDPMHQVTLDPAGTLSSDPLCKLNLNPKLNESPENFYRVHLDSNLNNSPRLECQASAESKYNQASEIGVFDAEKYFRQEAYGEKLENPEMGGSRRVSKEDRISISRPKASLIKSCTPSVHSNSSWNSQSALLSNLRRDPSTSSRKQVSSKRFFTAFGCNNCSGKRSVDISDNAGASKRTVHLGQQRSLDISGDFSRNLGVFAGNRQKRPEFPQREEMMGIDKKEGCSAFPISSPVGGDLTIGGPLDVEENSRFSLEVFGTKDNLSATLQKKLSRLSLKNGRRNVAIPVGPTKSRDMDGKDDAASDASSDLFEISSLTGTGTGNQFFNLGPSEDVSSWAGATTCYEPSEASVEWSVVTASAANFSVASDFDGERLLTEKKKDREEMIMAATRTPLKSKSPSAKQPRQSPVPTSLLGCKSDKAVKVAADACQQLSPKISNPRSRRQSDESITHLARLQAQAQAQVISPMSSDAHRRRLSESMAPLARLEGDALVMDFQSAQLTFGGRSLFFSPRALYMY